MGVRETDERLTPAQPGMFAIRSQDLEKKYFDAGVFTAFPAARVRAPESAGSDADFIGYILPKGNQLILTMKLIGSLQRQCTELGRCGNRGATG